MMKNYTGTSNSRRSPIDSFEFNFREFEQTNKLLANIENKLSDYVTQSKEDTSPHSDTKLSQIRNPNRVNEKRNRLGMLLEDGFSEHDAQDEDAGSNSENSIQNQRSNIQNSYKEQYETSNRKSKVSSKGVYESQLQDYESYNDHEHSNVDDEEEEGEDEIKTTSSNGNRAQNKMEMKILVPPSQNISTRLSVKNYVSEREREKFDKIEDTMLGGEPSMHSRNVNRKSYRNEVSQSESKIMETTAKIESFYQNKVKVLEERVRVDEQEIYRLRKMNEDLRLELVKIRNEFQEYKQDNSQDIWKKFKQQKESLSLGLGEGLKSQEATQILESKDLLGQRGDERSSEGRVSTKQPQSFEYKKRDRSNRQSYKNEKNNRRLVDGNSGKLLEDPRLLNEISANDFVEEDEKIGFLFKLINGYKQEVNLLKESNTLIQKQLQQEIKHLKKDLDSQREQNLKMSQMLQNERKSSQFASVRESGRNNSRNNSLNNSHVFKGEPIELMSRDDLAKLTRSLQDSYRNLEEKHNQQVRENEKIMSELNQLRTKTREDYKQFDEAYQKIFEGRDPNSVLTKYGDRNLMKSGHKKARASWKENVTGNSPPVKDRTRREQKSLVETGESGYVMGPIMTLKEEKEKGIRANNYRSEKARDGNKNASQKDRFFNKSFEKYDEFIEEIKKVKRTVEGKIAEKGDKDVGNKSMNAGVNVGRQGLNSKETRKKSKRSASKGRTLDVRF